MLEQLTLAVSQACNLNCNYCYAFGGSYGIEPHLMKESTAIDSIANVLAVHGKIGKIMIFGGEPFLNPGAIREIVDYVSAISPPPKITVVTNGTLCNDDILRYLRSNSVRLVVSLDGPRQIHDANRLFCDGSSTFAIVSELLERLKKTSYESFDIEATYSKAHLEAQLDVRELYEYLAEFEPESINISPEIALFDSGSAQKEVVWLLHSYLNTSAYLMCERFTGNRPEFKLLAEVISALRASTSERDAVRFCIAGSEMLAVDSFGAVYPCHMFFGRNCFKVADNVAAVKRMLAPIDKSMVDACKDCWLRDHCTYCIGRLKTENGNYMVRSSFDCALRKGMALLVSNVLRGNFSLNAISQALELTELALAGEFYWYTSSRTTPSISAINRVPRSDSE